MYLLLHLLVMLWTPSLFLWVSLLLLLLISGFLPRLMRLPLIIRSRVLLLMLLLPMQIFRLFLLLLAPSLLLLLLLQLSLLLSLSLSLLQRQLGRYQRQARHHAQSEPLC